MWIHWRSFSPNGSLPSPTLLILHRVHLGVFWQQATQSGRATRKATGNSVTRGWPGLETRIRKIQREERHFQVWISNPNSPKVSLDLWNVCEMTHFPNDNGDSQSFCSTPIPGNHSKLRGSRQPVLELLQTWLQQPPTRHGEMETPVTSGCSWDVLFRVFGVFFCC